MTNYKGKEMRFDTESQIEAFFWLVFLSVTIRIAIGGFIFRSNFYMPFINKELTFAQGWILFTILSMMNAFFFVFILDMERWLPNCIKYSIIPPFISGTLFYMQTYKIQIIMILVVLGVFIVVPTVQYIKKLRIARKKHKRLKKFKVFRRLARTSYELTMYLAIYVFAFFIIAFIFVPSFDGKRDVCPSVKAVSYKYDVTSDSIYSLLDKNKKALLVLQEENWKEATETERMNGLQTLLNVETSYFKITPLMIQMKEMGEYRLGYYSDVEQMAYICPEQVHDENPIYAMETVIHEGRHHFQHEIIRYAIENKVDLSMPIYSDVREWAINNESYFDKEGEMTVEEYLVYKTQPLESDANQYGSDMTVLISAHINSWE